MRCPTCDRADCEWWTFVPGKPPPATVNVSALDGRRLPEDCRAQNAFDDCGRHAVDWRQRALDRCEVCDEDGLIWLEEPVDGVAAPLNKPEACPCCGGTRSGFAGRMRAERDVAVAERDDLRLKLAAMHRRAQAAEAERDRLRVLESEWYREHVVHALRSLRGALQDTRNLVRPHIRYASVRAREERRMRAELADAVRERDELRAIVAGEPGEP
jgi:hypothetical protein